MSVEKKGVSIQGIPQTHERVSSMGGGGSGAGMGQNSQNQDRKGSLGSHGGINYF